MILLIFFFRFNLRDCWQSWFARCRSAIVSFSQLSHGQRPCMGLAPCCLLLYQVLKNDQTVLVEVRNLCYKFPLLCLFSIVVQYTSPKGNLGCRDGKSLSCNVCPAFCGEQPRPLLFTAMCFVPRVMKRYRVPWSFISPALQSLFAPSLFYTHTHTHTHTHTRTHTRAHTHTRARAHAHTCARTRTHVHTHTHTHTHTQTHTHTNTSRLDLCDMTIHNPDGQMKKIEYSTHPSLQPHSVVRPKHSVIAMKKPGYSLNMQASSSIFLVCQPFTTTEAILNILAQRESNASLCVRERMAWQIDEMRSM